MLAIVCQRMQTPNNVGTCSASYKRHNHWRPCVRRMRAWPQKCWKSSANGSKIVGLRFDDHETKDMLRVVGQQCCVHLHGKDMLGIVIQQFCFRLRGSWPGNITPTPYGKKNGTNFAEKSGEFMTSYYKDVPSYSSQAAATLARYLEKMTKLKQKL